MDSKTTATDFITPDELSALLDISAFTLNRWRYRGGGPPYYRIGKHVRYKRSEVDAWLATRRREAATPSKPRDNWQPPGSYPLQDTRVRRRNSR